MELIELHVHQGDAAPVGDGDAVARAGQRVRGDLEDPTEPAGGDQDGLGVERVDLAGLDVHGDDSAAAAIVGEEDVEQVMLVEEVDFVLDPLLVEGLDDHVAGAVGGIAGAAHRAPRRSCGCARRIGAGRSCPSGVRLKGRPMCSSSSTASIASRARTSAAS